MAGTALAFLPGHPWIAELAASLRFQLAFGTLIAAACCAAGETRWKPAVALSLAVVNLWPAVALRTAEPTKRSGEGVALRLASVNVLADNDEYGRFREWVTNERPDVLAVIEVSSGWAAELESEYPAYPYRVIEPRPGAFGIALLSQHPIKRFEVDEVGDPGPPLIDATIDRGGCEVRVVVVHTFPPVTPAMFDARDSVLDAVAERMASGGAGVVVGDVNATLYAPVLGRFEAATGLRDAATGRWRHVTWMPMLGPLGLDLDRAFVPAGWVVDGLTVGGAIGSDHLPVLYSLWVPSRDCAGG